MCSGRDGDWFLVQTEGFFLSAEAAHSCFLPIRGHVPTCSEVLELLGLFQGGVKGSPVLASFLKAEELLLRKL